MYFHAHVIFVITRNYLKTRGWQLGNGISCLMNVYSYCECIKLFIITGPLDSISIDKKLASLIFNNNIITIA